MLFFLPEKSNAFYFTKKRIFIALFLVVISRVLFNIIERIPFEIVFKKYILAKNILLN